MSTEIKPGPVIGLRSLPRKQILATLAGVMIALFLSSLDQTIVGTAMPRIIADLGGFTHYTWLTTAYLVTSTVALPITGKLTDMYGRKSFYIGGIAVFIVGSLFSGLSTTMVQIVIARGVQGLGAGVMLANAFTVVGDLFPPAERGKYQGFLSAVFGISAIIGPILGGFITDNFSWHWIFYVNVPLGIATIVLFIFFFPDFRLDRLRHRIDYAGIGPLILAIIPLLLALSFGGTEFPWLSAPIIGMFVLSAIAIMVFPLVESRSQEPIVPLGIFRNPIVALSIPIIFFTGFSMFGAIIFVPLYLQGVLGLSATASGSFLVPMTLGQVVGSFASGQALSRNGRYRLQGALGLGITALGMGLLSMMSPQTSFANAIFNVVLVGIGLGIIMPLYTIIVQNAVTYNFLGAATASVPFFRSLGGAAGLAVMGSVVTNRFASEFLADLPAATRAVIPPPLLQSLTRDAQALVSPEAQAALQDMFNQLGPQGAALYEQTLQVLRRALNSGLTEIFLIAMAITIATFVVNLFLKEIPLHKQHVLSEPAEEPVADKNNQTPRTR